MNLARVALPLLMIAVTEQPRAEELSFSPGESPANEASDESSHLNRGLELYQEQRYTEAVEQFKAGHASAKDPRFLYALAQALRMAQRCEEAIPHYQAFLAASPTSAQEAAALANLERCQMMVAAEGTEVRQGASGEPSTAPTPAPNPAPTKLTSIPVPSRSSPPMQVEPNQVPPPWYADPLGLGLVGGGLLATTSGAVLLWLSSQKLDEAERLESGASQGSYEEHRERLELGRTEALLGGVALGAGLCAVSLGVLRYHHVVAEQPLTARFTFRPGAAKITVGRAF